MIHDADAGSERHGFFLIMRDDDESDAELFLQIDEFELCVLAQLLVESTEGLVEQQQLRPLYQ